MKKATSTGFTGIVDPYEAPSNAEIVLELVVAPFYAYCHPDEPERIQRGNINSTLKSSIGVEGIIIMVIGFQADSAPDPCGDFLHSIIIGKATQCLSFFPLQPSYRYS